VTILLMRLIMLRVCALETESIAKVCVRVFSLEASVIAFKLWYNARRTAPVSDLSHFFR